MQEPRLTVNSPPAARGQRPRAFTLPQRSRRSGAWFQQRGGQVIGTSDNLGAYPLEHPITSADLHASSFAALGYDSQNLNYLASDGRPTALSDGTPIRELF